MNRQKLPASACREVDPISIDMQYLVDFINERIRAEKAQEREMDGHAIAEHLLKEFLAAIREQGANNDV